MRGEVHIMVYCPIDTLQWGQTHSALVCWVGLVFKHLRKMISQRKSDPSEADQKELRINRRQETCTSQHFFYVSVFKPIGNLQSQIIVQFCITDVTSDLQTLLSSLPPATLIFPPTIEASATNSARGREEMAVHEAAPGRRVNAEVLYEDPETYPPAIMKACRC